MPAVATTCLLYTSHFDQDTCERALKDHFQVGTLEGIGLKDYDSGMIASGALFLYLTETQKTAMSHKMCIRDRARDPGPGTQ